jgi:hypothetical protein
MTLFGCAGPKFGCAPSTMKPPITTLSPVWTKARVLIVASVDSVGVVAGVAIARLLVSPTRQTTTNNGRRSSFCILGGLVVSFYAIRSPCCKRNPILASPKGLPDDSCQVPPADGAAFCMKTYRSQIPRGREGRRLAFHGLFYGLTKFSCKRAQFCVTRCKPDWLGLPMIRNAVQHSKTCAIR